MNQANIDVQVRAIRYEAQDILSYEFGLLPGDSGELPPFTAGAHVDVHLQQGLVRSYSLLNNDCERNRYVIAVSKAADGRGGSRYMHEKIKVGDRLSISQPRNHFPVRDDAGHSIMIAGGIGITPMWSMVQRLQRLGRSWELHYSARTRQHAALLDQVESLPAEARERVHINFDQEPGAAMLDLAALVASGRPGTHFYCCGPTGMLKAFEAATSHLDPECVHLEYFSAGEAVPASGVGFQIELARSGRSIEVAAGATVLDALLKAGIDISYSCMEGVCGSCEVTVLEGEPDHRDMVLTRSEKASNRCMMVCCSGSKSDRLVLDL